MNNIKSYAMACGIVVLAAAAAAAQYNCASCRAAQRHLGGGIDCSALCGGSSSGSGSSSSGSSYDPAAEQRRQEAERQRQEEERRRREEEARKKAEEEARKKAEEEARKKAKFEADKKDALQQLKGGSGGLLDCEDESCDDTLSFLEYHDREKERREIVANLNKNLAVDQSLKPRVDWCKLNAPLPPSPSGECYCDKSKAYEGRLAAWRGKCAAAAVALPAKRKTAAAGGRLASYCLGVYDAEVNSCEGNHFEMSDCINNSIGIYLRCLEGENKPEGVPLR